MPIFAIGPVPGSQVSLSPLHPLSHGGFRIHCELDGDVISHARVEIGFVHRSAEKLFEVRDYRQGAMLANRHVWTSPTAGEYAYVRAVEELLGLSVSSRADALRLVFAEVDRVLSHLSYLAPTLGESSAREELADFMSVTTGSRMHHQVIRIGGVAVDLDVEQRAKILKLLDAVEREVDVLRSSPLLEKAAGIGPVDQTTIDSYGITGPIARASGVRRDERMSGYGAYHDFEPVVARDADARARLVLMMDEIEASCAMIVNAFSQDVEGELLLRTPRNLRLPEGQAHCFVEGALGSNGVSLFSDAGLAPTRARLRTASLGNMHALESVLVGTSQTQLPLLLASWPVLAGDADR